MKNVRILFKVLFIIYICMVLFLCLYSFKESDIDLSSYIFGIRADRVAHFVMFFPYPFSAWLAVKGELRERFGKMSHAIVLTSGVILALAAEALQSLTPARDTDPLDLASNIAAIISASIIIFALEKKIDNVWPDRLQ